VWFNCFQQITVVKEATKNIQDVLGIFPMERV